MLSALAAAHGCDKADANHTHLNRSYCDVYAQYFEPIRFEPVVLLELGIRDGASLRMWSDYFPRAEIHGVDIDAAAVQTVDMSKYPRVSMHIADQSKPEQLERVLQTIGKPIDIVIDDASHLVDHQLISHSVLAPHTRRFYVLEDMRCSYGEFLEGHDLRAIWPGMKYNDPWEPNDRSKIDKWLQDLQRQMDFHTSQKLAAIHSHPMLVFLEYFF
ncbi:hypothetical protein CL622_03715, partial [archaeon]|nr:hypothetical protein [archaeon]